MGVLCRDDVLGLVCVRPVGWGLYVWWAGREDGWGHEGGKCVDGDVDGCGG